jgi:uroporphyrinogen III methyltransferase/synthase
VEGTCRPLEGQTVVITRAAHQSKELKDLLAAEGATVFDVPTIRVQAVHGAELAEVDRSIMELATGRFDGLILTSANAVELFAERLHAMAIDTAKIERVAIFVVGPATAGSAAKVGLSVTATASDAIGEGLVSCVCGLWGDSLTGRRFLFPRAREGRQSVATLLRELGAEVQVTILYETVPLDDGLELPRGAQVDWITFASPSAVRAFLHHLRVPAGAKIACIGPVTTAAAREAGLEVAVTSQVHTAKGLVEAISRSQRVGVFACADEAPLTSPTASARRKSR